MSAERSGLPVIMTLDASGAGVVVCASSRPGLRAMAVAVARARWRREGIEVMAGSGDDARAPAAVMAAGVVRWKAVAVARTAGGRTQAVAGWPARQVARGLGGHLRRLQRRCRQVAPAAWRRARRSRSPRRRHGSAGRRSGSRAARGAWANSASSHAVFDAPRGRWPIGMQHAVQQAQRLRQQQRADQQAGQRAAQGQGDEAAVHAVAARPGSLTTVAPHNPPARPGGEIGRRSGLKIRRT